MLVICIVHTYLESTRGSRKECLPKAGSKYCSKTIPVGDDNEVVKKVIYQEEEEEEEDGSGRSKQTVMSGRNKPVKIRSYNSSRKYGVAAKSVKELLDKGCKLLKVMAASKRFRSPFD